MIHVETDRLCMECGAHIAGRTDKKFCNDQCRTAWHNRQHGRDSPFIRSVNSILRNNRRILAELTADGSKEIRSVALARLGFQFDYFTGAKKHRNGFLECFCYDQCFVPVSNGVYLLKSK